MPSTSPTIGPTSASPPTLPYKLACLCDLRDKDGRILLLKRTKSPNFGLCSPIGGKLDMETGESPAQCAQREIEEEAGLRLPIQRLHLAGLISEKAYEGKGHWLMFYYRVLGPVWVEPHDMKEGRLDWFRLDELDGLPLPETDRRIIWPMIRKHEKAAATDPHARPGFFTLHIDLTKGDGEHMTWSVEQEEG
ncbi:MAG: NUDIX domain-containing protein [Pyrinomonadaceae bacterium]|nr:NUDIX domain-containing protein [Phycisphaerales bacterium]